MTPHLGEYDAACDDYFRRWATYNEVLYRMCRRYPGHSDPGHINAKVGIIGRSFQTGIERKVKSKGGQGSTLATVGAHVLKHGKEVEETFKPLARFAEPLTPQKLANIIGAHGRFNTLVRGITLRHQSVRSFASKYMHFHCPVVPIYDMFAAAQLRREVRWHDSLMIFGDIPGADAEYHYFCARFWHLYQALRYAGKDATVRLVDIYLLR